MKDKKDIDLAKLKSIIKKQKKQMNKIIRKGLKGPVVWIIIGIVVILVVGFFGFQLYNGFQLQKIESEKRIKEQQDLIVEQQKALEETKQMISGLTDSQKKNQEATAEAQRIVATAQAATADAQAKLQQEKTNNPDLSSIIAQWRPSVAYVECDFEDTSGSIYATQKGSGLVGFFDPKETTVLTNRHVVIYENEYAPKSCNVKIPNDNNTFLVDRDNIFVASKSSASSDWGFLKIKFPDAYIKTLNYAQNNLCINKASVGDSIVILGYPSIGSTTDITATEGIISGYDGDYYITSAKVEHGNSGGVAISIRDNCYLGIPTFVGVGSIESLARILSFNAILNR